MERGAIRSEGVVVGRSKSELRGLRASKSSVLRVEFDGGGWIEARTTKAAGS
jgi:hypothetical protein